MLILKNIYFFSDSDEDLECPAKLKPISLQFSCETSDTSVESESEYMVMTAAKAQTESYYMPMTKLKANTLFTTTEEENGYMIMSGKKST